MSDLKEVYSGYFINKRGQVFSSFKGKMREIKQSVQWSYPRVRIVIDGKETSRHVHRLLAIAFIPNPYNKEQVNHKDGDKLNYELSNLEWVTRQENKDHAFKSGLLDNCPRVGEDNGRAIITEDDVLEIVKLLNDKVTHRDIAAKYGLEKSSISNIVCGKAWSGVVGNKLDHLRTSRDDSKLDNGYIIEKILSGFKMQEIANELDVKVDRIYTINNKYIKSQTTIETT